MSNTFDSFPAESKVWIYQSNRNFTSDEINRLSGLLETFCVQWTAHQNQLRATGTVLCDRFIVLAVDETMHNASGCSIDKSVKFLKEIEQTFSVQLFDRMDIAYEENGSIHTFPIQQLQQYIAEKKVSADTVIFNNALSVKGDFDTRWRIPLGKSFLQNKIRQAVS